MNITEVLIFPIQIRLVKEIKVIPIIYDEPNSAIHS
jgi:hypothetical protein